MEKTVAEVLKEINELVKLRAVGAKKAKKMAAYVVENKREIADYRENGMRIGDIADLVGDLV